MGLELLFVRHGESELNVDPNSKRIYTGRNQKTPLTPKGVQQANLLGMYLSSEDIKEPRIQLIYTSPTIRTLQTAAYANQWLQRYEPKPKIVEELAELDQGDLEGKEKKSTKGVTDFWAYVPEGGKESQRDVYERVNRWVEKEFEKKKGKYLIVTHENVIKCFLTGLLGLDKDQAYHMDIPNCSLTKLRRTNGTWEETQRGYAEYLENLTKVVDGDDWDEF